jgi:Zn finger protein HypA/HybF involved in hydrogenase expression
MTDEYFIQICLESETMAKAAVKLGIHFNTFKRRALKLGVYKPNQPGIGINKNMPRVSLKEILDGQHPHYQTYKLKVRLLEEGIKENKCENCGLDSWNGQSINCELDHKDGNRNNHKIENLRILCPNCHSQTDTFRSKNIKKDLVN